MPRQSEGMAFENHLVGKGLYFLGRGPERRRAASQHFAEAIQSLRVTGYGDAFYFIINVFPLNSAFLIFENISFVTNDGKVSRHVLYRPIHRLYLPFERAGISRCRARRAIVRAGNADNLLVLRIERFDAPTIRSGMADGWKPYRRND